MIFIFLVALAAMAVISTVIGSFFNWRAKRQPSTVRSGLADNDQELTVDISAAAPPDVRRKLLIAFTAAVAMVGLAAGIAIEGLTNDNSSHSPVTAVTSWATVVSGRVESGLAVVNGVVYVGDVRGIIYALDGADGNVLWSYATGGVIASRPAVANNTVYIGSSQQFIALNAANGKLRWRQPMQGDVRSGPVVSGKTVYFGSDNGTVCALDASTGRIRWLRHVGGSVYSTPAIADGVVYVGSFDHRVYALSAATGRVYWTYMTEGRISASPVINKGILYVGSADGNVYAITTATGKVAWKFTTGGVIFTTAAVSHGNLYVGSLDSLYALNAITGHLVWRYLSGGPIYSDPAVGGNVVYFGSADGNLYANDAMSGGVLWIARTGHAVNSSPAVTQNYVYVGNSGSRILAFVAGPPSSITVSCRVNGKSQPGSVIRLTYRISSSSVIYVGLGGGLYNALGTDYSTGFGDIDRFRLRSGSITISRPFKIPSNLPSGRYEIDAEIWPANQVGANGANTFADAICEYISIPKR